MYFYINRICYTNIINSVLTRCSDYTYIGINLEYTYIIIYKVQTIFNYMIYYVLYTHLLYALMQLTETVYNEEKNINIFLL